MKRKGENTARPLENEMQTNDGLACLANKLKVLSLENRKQIPKSTSPNLKFCDLPINAAANSIIPLCLENFAFQPSLLEEQMLYHNLANRISEIPEIKVRIATIIHQTQDIQQPDKLYFVNGQWQQKQVSEEEDRTN